MEKSHEILQKTGEKLSVSSPPLQVRASPRHQGDGSYKYNSITTHYPVNHAYL
jgi:hypothetical protein